MKSAYLGGAAQEAPRAVNGAGAEQLLGLGSCGAAVPHQGLTCLGGGMCVSYFTPHTHTLGGSSSTFWGVEHWLQASPPSRPQSSALHPASLAGAAAASGGPPGHQRWSHGSCSRRPACGAPSEPPPVQSGPVPEALVGPRGGLWTARWASGAGEEPSLPQPPQRSLPPDAGLGPQGWGKGGWEALRCRQPPRAQEGEAQAAPCPGPRAQPGSCPLPQPPRGQATHLGQQAPASSWSRSQPGSRSSSARPGPRCGCCPAKGKEAGLGWAAGRGKAGGGGCSHRAPQSRAPPFPSVNTELPSPSVCPPAPLGVPPPKSGTYRKMFRV